MKTVLLAVGLILSGCAVDDYAIGLSSFSKAVAAQDKAETSLIATADAIRTDDWLDQVGKHPEDRLQIDLLKCEEQTGYQPGDCRVTINVLGSPPRPTGSSTSALDRYAGSLAAVATDNDCATLSANAALLSTSVAGLAHTLNASAADKLLPLISLATISGCRALAAERLKMLRTATATADPFIQQLVAPIQDKDGQLVRIIMRDAAAQVDGAAVAYNASPSRTGLQVLVHRTEAVDAAEALSLYRTIAAIAKLHGQLARDLQKRRVDLTHIIAEAQSIADDATSARAALTSISSPSKGT